MEIRKSKFEIGGGGLGIQHKGHRDHGVSREEESAGRGERR
jgi:hypothetical protein